MADEPEEQNDSGREAAAASTAGMMSAANGEPEPDLMSGVMSPGAAATAAAAQPGMTTPPQTSASTPAAKPPADDQHPAAKPGFFHQVLEMLGGGPHTAYNIDPDTGKLITTTSPASKGELARHVIAGMLTGLAAGAQQRGPNAGLRSFGAGAEASMSLAEAREQQKKVQAQKDYENQQAGILRKAQVSRYNFEELMALRQANRQDQEAWDRHMDSQMQLTKQLHDAGAQLVPVMVEGKDINQGDTPDNDADLMKAYTAGQIKAAPNAHLLLTTVRNDAGKMVHHVWNVPDDLMSTEMPIPDDIRKFYNLPDGAQQSSLRQILNLTANMQDRNNNDINEQLKKEQIEHEKAATQHEKTETAKVEEETKVLKSNAGGRNPDGSWNPASIPVSLVEGTMDPTQLSKRSADYNQKIQAANEYSMAKYGKPFDLAQAQSDYKYSSNAQTQNTLKMIAGMNEPGGAIDIAEGAAKALPQLPSATLNKVFNATATEFGSREATDFHTAMLGLADEYSKVMGGGVSSDTGRQQALDILKQSYSKGQLAGAIAIMRRDIGARQAALVGNNRYLRKQYPLPTAPPSGATMKVPGSDGRFHWSDGKQDLGVVNGG